MLIILSSTVFAWSNAYAQPGSEKGQPSANPFAPCDFLEYAPGAYSMTFSEIEPHIDFIDSQGGARPAAIPGRPW
jgi:hypothetical protein